MIWLLANWRLVAFAAIVTVLGIQTMRLQDLEAEYDEFVLEVKAAGREAQAKAEAINAHHELVLEELEHDIQTEREARARERKERSDRFAALYGKYHGLLNADPGGGGVPEANSGAAEPVHPQRLCFDRARFIDGVRQSLGDLYRETEPLLRSGEDGLDDRARWGQWARLVGACDAKRGD